MQVIHQILELLLMILDNKNEFKWLSKYVILIHNNILSLCIYFKLISIKEGEKFLIV